MTAAYQVGQKVRLTRGDEALNGEVMPNYRIEVGWESAPIGEWVRRGFDLSAVEPPKPELPTEPGYYADVDGNAWQLDDGGFYCSLGDVQPEAFAPFTKLDTMAAHAAEIADFVQHRPTETRVASAHAIRREFGVQS